MIEENNKINLQTAFNAYDSWLKNLRDKAFLSKILGDTNPTYSDYIVIGSLRTP